MSQNLAGLKIRAQRKRIGLTQGELARRAGISASYLNLIELNKRAIAGALVDRIAAGLGIERSELDDTSAETTVTSTPDKTSAVAVRSRTNEESSSNVAQSGGGRPGAQANSASGPLAATSADSQRKSVRQAYSAPCRARSPSFKKAVACSRARRPPPSGASQRARPA